LCLGELGRWNSVQSFMGPFVVLAVHPVFGHASDLIEEIKDVAVEDLYPVGPFEPFDVGILDRLARLMN
jgi:hypothetical protein